MEGYDLKLMHLTMYMKSMLGTKISQICILNGHKFSICSRYEMD
jgi:hypothetical protein